MHLSIGSDFRSRLEAAQRDQSTASHKEEIAVQYRRLGLASSTLPSRLLPLDGSDIALRPSLLSLKRSLPLACEARIPPAQRAPAALAEAPSPDAGPRRTRTGRLTPRSSAGPVRGVASRAVHLRSKAGGVPAEVRAVRRPHDRAATTVRTRSASTSSSPAPLCSSVMA